MSVYTASQGLVMNRNRKTIPRIPKTRASRDPGWPSARPAGWAPVGAGRLAAHRRQHPVHGRGDGPVAVAPREPGRHLLADDPRGPQVGEPILQAVADLDPHLAVLGQQEDRRPVVQPLAADAPGLEGAGGPVLQRLLARCVLPIQTITWWPPLDRS